MLLCIKSALRRFAKQWVWGNNSPATLFSNQVGEATVHYKKELMKRDHKNVTIIFKWEKVHRQVKMKEKKALLINKRGVKYIQEMNKRLCSDDQIIEVADWRSLGWGRSLRRPWRDRMFRNQEGEPTRPPDGSLMLGCLQEASVVGHDLVLREVQAELKSHQNGELEGYQLPAVYSEPLFQFLWRQIGKARLNKSSVHCIHTLL